MNKIDRFLSIGSDSLISSIETHMCENVWYYIARTNDIQLIRNVVSHPILYSIWNSIYDHLTDKIEKLKN